MSKTSSNTSGALAALSNDLAGIVAGAGKVVVAVNGRPRTPSSGVHWSPGVIVTTHHTLRRDEEITVTFSDGASFPATLAGRDASTDLAVLKVEKAGGEAAEIGDANAVKAGHLVLAVGRAETPADGPSASLAFMSAPGGVWRTWQGGEIDRLLPLDLAIFLGFSGGALVDATGRVLGINTTGLWRRRAVAIPASTVERVMRELLDKGRVSRAHLGLGMQPVRLPEELRRKLNISPPDGMIVVTVEPGGPAEKAGALIGDVLVGLDDKPAASIEDVQAALAGSQVGKTLRASVIRGGQPRELAIVLAERV